MGAQGIASLDFGAFPGKPYATVAVSEVGVVAGSEVDAWVMPVATADHSSDEHRIEALQVRAGDVSAGVGFTISGVSMNAQRLHGIFNLAWVWN